MKREDGKLVGCAFIQYDKVNQAAKAIHHANGKELLGRQIIIDWAVNRKKFVKHLHQQKHSLKVKTEDENDENATKIKQESDDDDSENEGSQNDESDADDGMESGSDNIDDNDDAANSDDDPESDKDEKKPIHKKSNDVAEGCTVFIKNLPFDSTKDDLYKVCRQFGPLYYAVITVDKVSGHSKGNGFVKFKVIF